MSTRLLLPTVLFTLTALASFSVWALGSRLYSSEAGMYALCAVVFFGLGGLSLTPGAGLSGAKERAGFALRFAAGFAIYAFVWSLAWFTFRSSFGEVAGSFLGLLGLVAVLRPEARREAGGLLGAVAGVFLWHTLGYYTGGLAYDALQGRGAVAVDLPFERETVVTLARLSWGLFYGLGLGFGLAALAQRPAGHSTSSTARPAP